MPQNHEIGEKHLVKKVQQGCHVSFTILFKKYGKKLYNFSYKYTNSQVESEGVVQEVFLKIWQRRHTLNPDLSFNSFVITIAKHSIFNLMKKNANRKTYKDQIDTSIFISEETEQKIIFSDLEEIARQRIDKLPPKRKQIFLLRRDTDLSIKEISEKLNISESTVENQMNRAIKTLKSDLAQFNISQNKLG